MQVLDQARLIQQGGLLVEVDEEINVAVRFRLPAGD